MCGITGFIDFNKRSDEEIIIKMSNMLSHRGPDDKGYSFYDNKFAQIGLGHRRLSILDLSSLAHQPMNYLNYEIVFNGEIYNYREIRKELEEYGYKFKSTSDTEVVIASFHKWGVDAVRKFIGMFAFVLYDKEKEIFYFFRDRTGVKPLYYYYSNGLFLFGSELKSFHKHPYFKKEISLDGLSLFFRFGYILQPYTIFKNTYKLPAGHYAVLTLKNRWFEILKYWDVVDYYNLPKLKISFDEAKKEIHRILKSAFEYRMVSDVPVGLFLSGGYDSSCVAAILQKDRTEKIKTFTIGFYEKKYNEAEYAKKVAEYLGTDHTEFYCTKKDAEEILPLITEIWDEPFGDSSAIPTILVSRMARKKVKVCLSADGGDEIFGGYDKYLVVDWYYSIFRKVPLKSALIYFFSKIKPLVLKRVYKNYNFSKKYSKFIEWLRNIIDKDPYVKGMEIVSEHFTCDFIRDLLNKDTCIVKTCFDDYLYLNSENDNFNRMLAIDYKTYLVDDILVKVERATMSAGLEGREPFLDHRIVEFMAQLPSEYKVLKGNTKVLLKSIVREVIPEEIIERPKMGFGIPIIEWFMDDKLKNLVFEYLCEEKVKNIEFLNYTVVEQIKKEWLRNSDENINKIWLLLVFMMWYEKWME